ncbi:hypothetical protein [Streptomyces sp. WAC 00631]
MPGRRLPGGVVQEDSPYILRSDVAEVAKTCE